MRTWADVAVLARTKNLKGRFVAHPAPGLPFLLEEGYTVSFVPPRTDVPRSGTVEHVKLIEDGKAEVSFAGIDDPATCSEMAGMHCLMKRGDIPEEAFEEPSDLWSGWSVVDGEHVLGEVEFVDDERMQPLMSVSTPDGSILVPVVDEIVENVDYEHAVICVNLPAGLMDL